jgi:hypothetical protein
MRATGLLHSFARDSFANTGLMCSAERVRRVGKGMRGKGMDTAGCNGVGHSFASIPLLFQAVHVPRNVSVGLAEEWGAKEWIRQGATVSGIPLLPFLCYSRLCPCRGPCSSCWQGTALNLRGIPSVRRVIPPPIQGGPQMTCSKDLPRSKSSADRLESAGDSIGQEGYPPTDSGRTTDALLEGSTAEQIICGPP